MLRSFLGTGLLRRLPAAPWGARGIITVKVNDPSTRGDERSKDVMQGESLLRRDLMLRLMTAVDPESCAWHVYRHVCGRVSANRHAHRHVHRP